jgi:hypothetical protein
MVRPLQPGGSPLIGVRSPQGLLHCLRLPDDDDLVASARGDSDHATG